VANYARNVEIDKHRRGPLFFGHGATIGFLCADNPFFPF
jgi:hypothetical protein